MDQNSRQLRDIRWQIAELRRVMLMTIDELAAKVDVIAGPEPEGQGSDWVNKFEKYEAEK